MTHALADYLDAFNEDDRFVLGGGAADGCVPGVVPPTSPTLGEEPAAASGGSSALGWLLLFGGAAVIFRALS